MTVGFMVEKSDDYSWGLSYMPANGIAGRHQFANSCCLNIPFRKSRSNGKFNKKFFTKLDGRCSIAMFLEYGPVNVNGKRVTLTGYFFPRITFLLRQSGKPKKHRELRPNS